MLQIETRGAWRDMGRQMAETFREWFAPVLDHFGPWLAQDLNEWRPAIASLRTAVAEHCPHLIDETLGMADALGWDPDLLLGLRYFNEVKHYVQPGCSGLFLADSDRGPLLARTCDIEPDIGAQIQIARVNRPAGGTQTVSVTYLPLTGGVGFNEYGLAITGSSASARGTPSTEGLPTAVLSHLILAQCRTVEDVRRLVAKHRPRGKGANQIVCDASGASMLLEFAPGRPVICTSRPPDRDWQACSNFCVSPELTDAPGPAYLANAYARYGRIAHRVGESLMPRTLAAVRTLFREISQPGLVCHEPHCIFRTAYVFVIEVRNRVMHLCPGHPAEKAYVELKL